MESFYDFQFLKEKGGEIMGEYYVLNGVVYFSRAAFLEARDGK